MGIRISKDHLHPSVIESITSLIGDLSQLETTAKGNAVEAINELLAGGGSKEEIEALIAEMAEGKELIANAIGEPLVAEDTFQAMSNDINGLLSTFKANMMNNGITVESGDRFKALIDKIATLADSEGGSGVKYITGTFSSPFTTGQCRPGDYVCNINWDFIPSILIISIPTVNTDMGSAMLTNYLISNLESSKMTTSSYPPVKITTNITNITNSSFTISMTENDTSSSYYFGIPTNSILTYYAIGVGEEDTALRDSLASILEEEGVEVLDEDDMADLITKVDQEFDKKNANAGLNIISATSQPASGTENQICVISDNPVGNIIVTSSDADITTSSGIIYGKLGLGTSDTSGNLTVGENVKINYHVDGFFQGGIRKNSYIYQNNTWNLFTKAGISIIRDKAYCPDTQYYGEFQPYTYNGNTTFDMQEKYGLNIYNYASDYHYYSFLPTPIDISAFNKIVMNWEISTYGNTPTQYLYIACSETKPTSLSGRKSGTDEPFDSFEWTRYVYSETSLVADISGLTGTYYIGIMHYYEDTGGLDVHDFYLE